MGIKFVLTGFSRFKGVDDNPTETLIGDLSGLLQQGLLKLHGTRVQAAVLPGIHVISFLSER